MIQKIRIVGKIAMVTATGDFHPLRQLKQLAKELEDIHFDGIVLFDLLAVNGLALNRFASMKFHGNEFDRSSFAVESNLSPSIKSEQDSIVMNDEAFLLGSVLSSNEITKFTH